MIEIMAEKSNNELQSGRYNVLGAGVIGLLTAIELAREGHAVTVHSREGRPGSGADSTSANAIGQFLPWVPTEHADSLLGGVSLQEVAEHSRGFYAEMAQEPHVTGVLELGNVELLPRDQEWPEGLPDAMHATEEKLEATIPFVDPDGEELACDTALKFNTFSINSRKTVSYLANKAEELGVEFNQKVISEEDLNELDGVIINAMGIGAEALDHTEVNYFKGHTFVIKPQVGYFPAQALSVEDLIMMPREDGTVVCGALYIEDPNRPVPEAREAKELFDRLGRLLDGVASTGIVDGLKEGLIENSEVLLHSAGYRVEVSAGGIRVAPDEKHERLLHAYGFGGIGWSVGPHFAQKIAEQAKILHSNLRG